ncbi:MAG TPA: M13 family metallopeptidase [Bryobacteraceae bacterium]|jgi:endothelin-converting enzyme/putative endopeptidase
MDLDAIDTTCKACDDFYQYSVGKWLTDHPIPADQSRWGKRWAGADQNLDVLKSVMGDLTATNSKAGTDARRLSDFNGACMDTATIDRLGERPLEPALKRISAITGRADLLREIAELHRTTSVGFVFSSDPDSDNPRQSIANISPPALGLPDRDYYLKDDAKSKESRARYTLHIQKLFVLAGMSAEKASAAARTILRMETDFARERLSRVDRRDPYKVNTHVEVAKLKELTPHFDWSEYYRTLGLPLDGTVRVSDTKYMKEFDRQLDADSIDDWKTFLTWNVVRIGARDLSTPFRQEMFEFEDRYLGGKAEPDPRWKFCVERADVLLSDALGQAYVAKAFPPESKARMLEMVKYILAALHDRILALDWMTDETKQKALVKLAAVSTKIGYPDKWRSYAGLSVSRGNYFASVGNALRFNALDDREQIGKPVDRTRWHMTPPTSNAYYSAVANEIVFPAGILLPPMFDPTAEDAVNYGAIGVAIGHEISHGFDDKGSQYDADGRLKNWWTDEDRKRFLERTDCVVDQFENYFIEPGVHHNGKLVLGESIGDLAGAHIAYDAYMKSIEGKPHPPVENGFTAEQRFFLSWGQARGDSMRIEQQRLMVVTDNHPVAKYRVIGPLSNMLEFRKAFGCKEGDPMVRAASKSCRVW